MIKFRIIREVEKCAHHFLFLLIKRQQIKRLFFESISNVLSNFCVLISWFDAFHKIIVLRCSKRFYGKINLVYLPIDELISEVILWAQYNGWGRIQVLVKAAFLYKLFALIHILALIHLINCSFFQDFDSILQYCLEHFLTNYWQLCFSKIMIWLIIGCFAYWKSIRLSKGFDFLIHNFYKISIRPVGWSSTAIYYKVFVDEINLFFFCQRIICL